MKLTIEQSGFLYEPVRNFRSSTVPPTTRRVSIDLTPDGSTPEEINTLLQRVGKVPSGSTRPERKYIVRVFSEGRSGEPCTQDFGANFFENNPPKSAHEALIGSIEEARSSREDGDTFLTAEIYVMPPNPVTLRRTSTIPVKKPTNLSLNPLKTA